MNKENFNNFIFILFLLLGFLIAIFLFSLSLRVFSLESLYLQMNYLLYSNFFNQYFLGLFSIFMIIFLIWLIRKKIQYSRNNFAVLQKTSLGMVKVSLGSIKPLITSVLKEVKEIKEAKSEIYLQKNGELRIVLQLGVASEAKIAEFSERIQQRLKDYLLEVAGIKTREVIININKIFYPEPDKIVNK
ncbi:MAG: hypothetical protein Kow00103_10320 [Candidatus Caldatribacteriota bacterium]